jgi:uncharacterized membrane protein YcaP (DUF421 family)
MSQISFFWTGWEPIARIVIVGTLTYFSILIILRSTGKRTLMNMNAFDFIVTVAFGAAFGRILTARQVPVSEAVTAFLLLATLQYVVAWLRVRSTGFSKLVSDQPALLFYKGNFVQKTIREQRIRDEDIRAAIRKQRLNSLSQVEAIVLESDGTIAVVKKSEYSDNSALSDLNK